MSLDSTHLVLPIRLGDPYRDEAAIIGESIAQLAPYDRTLTTAEHTARAWIAALRGATPSPLALENLLAEFPISSAEGLAFLRLAEALLRVPDDTTAIALSQDVFAPAEFRTADGPASAQVVRALLRLARKLLNPDDVDATRSLLDRLGERSFVFAARRAVATLAGQFVYASDMDAARTRALRNADEWVSFDMLGEGARSQAQAERYFIAYKECINATADIIGKRSQSNSANVSIKLSALHPKYTETNRARLLTELQPRLNELCALAFSRNVQITIDAEEAERLELSVDLMEGVIRAVKPPPFKFGFALQAYGKRAREMAQWAIDVARARSTPLAVRLVKGAYWDTEIKRSQELGVPDYPVFTQKLHTDLSYLAVATMMLNARDAIYPMFATHNAATLAAINALGESHPGMEFQRLHGMGSELYSHARKGLKWPVRIYAPVGQPRDLLAYLVRRLLENGANSSFVHQLADPNSSIEALTSHPRTIQPASTLPRPRRLFGTTRENSDGLDLQMRMNVNELEALLVQAQRSQFPRECAPRIVGVHHAGRTDALRSPIDHAQIGTVRWSTADDVVRAYAHARTAWSGWNATPVDERAKYLERAAELLSTHRAEALALLVIEAGKTLADAESEIREAIDFLRYYAMMARKILVEETLPGPTGETNTLALSGRGVWVAISPWNFPLAIFVGQVAAALVAGNCVLAKPAEQTPLIADWMVALMHEAGIGAEVLACVPGDGAIGAELVKHADCAGVVFTGSTAVAQHIARALAAKSGPLTPLIAETGGINAMIVDSTALPEQVVDAVVTSAFGSAGQRCSALRVLLVQGDTADDIIALLAGAMNALIVGDPRRAETDVGPIIDAEALTKLQSYEREIAARGKFIARAPAPDNVANSFAPCAYELPALSDVKEEVFGPVLHVVRYDVDKFDELIDAINALGYGLTLGIQTRILSRAQAIAARARVGNVYVNRSMIGAVVGVQPFGGQGLSGTGPKAGGPYYLQRFCTEQTLTINTAAAGGNATLLGA